MSQGDCRRLLTFGIPAVAVLLGLLWLRRCRRKRQGSERAGESTAETTTVNSTEPGSVRECEQQFNLKEEVEECFPVLEVTEKGTQSVLEAPIIVEEDSCVKEVDTNPLESTRQSNSREPMTTSTKGNAEMSSKIDIIQPSSQNIPKTPEGPQLDKPITKVSPMKTDKAVKKPKKTDDVPLKSNKSKKGKKSNRTADKENEKQLDENTTPNNIVGKLACLKLEDMKSLRERETSSNVGSERDSANHSPSDVMLGSPSMSNFSDAHSEGSSDSGKGHSDVAISPARTPAGGSSLAGDVAALSIYEFVLPQIMVGRLIGRHGAYLNEIKSTTQTNIFIKRHPESPRLKICAVEGTQSDIKKALQKIRQKFPLKKHPQLTLDKVSFISSSSPSLENMRLNLIEGINNDVLLSSLISAAHFFLQQPSHPTYPLLSALNYAMNQSYSSGDAPILTVPVKDAVCAAPTPSGWYRAQIISVEEENKTCAVRFLDYGGYMAMDSSMLRQIRGDFLTLPFQAVECFLANVAPIDDNGWSEEARLFVQSLTYSQLLQAQIYEYAEDGTPLVYLYSSRDSEVVLINEELVSQGFAQLMLPIEE